MSEGLILNNAAASVHRSNLDLSAQSFDIDIKQGTKYYTYAKTLTMGDISFWVVDEDFNIVAKSENFKIDWY
jgi:hypothetical protein